MFWCHGFFLLQDRLYTKDFFKKVGMILKDSMLQGNVI